MHRRTSLLAWGWLLLLGLAALVAPSASPPPDLLSILVPPFRLPHWLGTDTVGHDIWQSLLAGTRSALLISLPAALLANILGGFLGLAAGFFGNSRLQLPLRWGLAVVVALLTLLLGAGPLWESIWLLPVLAIGVAGVAGWLLGHFPWGNRSVAIRLDDTLQALIALIDSIPLLILILTVAAIQQPSPLGLVVLLASICWTTPARLVRAATLRTVALPYVLAAEAMGISPFRIVHKHIAPNVWPVLLTRIPLSIALIIGIETTLSFLGVGLPPDVASWGRLLAYSRQAPTAWWLILCPGVAIFSTVWALQALTRNKKTASSSGANVTK